MLKYYSVKIKLYSSVKNENHIPVQVEKYLNYFICGSIQIKYNLELVTNYTSFKFGFELH